MGGQLRYYFEAEVQEKMLQAWPLVGLHGFHTFAELLWVGLFVPGQNSDQRWTNQLCLLTLVLTLALQIVTSACIDTEGIQTFAGRAQWISSPSP